MKIILSGGGTLGPVVPLLAIAEIYKRHNSGAEFIWVGTKNGPEKELVKESGLSFYTIIAGKWRRYFSLWNIIDIFKIILAFFNSLFFLWQEKPDLLISGGGFVSVPLHWAGWLLGIPTWIHQQDVVPGLANRLMARAADKITTALQETVSKFPAHKTQWLGNPARDLTCDVAQGRKQFGLSATGPVIFALGGGTGSMTVNKLIMESVGGWPRDYEVIHLIGRERPAELNERAVNVFSNYHVYKFFTSEMSSAYAAADVVVARAGFATITELAALKKAAILIPMNGTHQEENVKKLSSQNAVLALDETHDSGLKLTQMVKELINNPDKRASLGQRLHEVLPIAKPEQVIKIIEELVAN
ncbi:MAG: hypothetical protein A3J93_00740 [Candidatus Magasanikbacteria bacterium RIFOXYC2_FULL_42_28]|uniref:UDP-N-acetylglucosamine--N-acetylmuramyl-(pentapeptide) pyrophosphoryl-undecaprenol N-acetylglucosamine transferase n=1 Tax=Candidatus Magasanikbacteria bacterium RIFOXYC2_FULL_42_28 TaxID=1798704 RepID=A0A1F6NXF8_9BACT|nr:MAG: hypothetical protein A3J93_00740 [Candidatus Magasanikbacteria bacterium RIFOXYC2_FULL_42_28]